MMQFDDSAPIISHGTALTTTSSMNCPYIFRLDKEQFPLWRGLRNELLRWRECGPTSTGSSIKYQSKSPINWILIKDKSYKPSPYWVNHLVHPHVRNVCQVENVSLSKSQRWRFYWEIPKHLRSGSPRSKQQYQFCFFFFFIRICDKNLECYRFLNIMRWLVYWHLRYQFIP